MTETRDDATPAIDSAAPAPPEGDFSRRKLRIAGGILIGQSFATSILPFSALQLMLIPLTHDFGWTAAEFSWAVTFLFFFGAVSLWPIGRIADKVGVRPVLLTGTIVVGLITLAMAFQTKSLTQFYLYYALLGMFGSTGVAYSKIVAALFTQHRGKAMAVLTAETNFALALVPIVVNWLMLTWGWRSVYLVFGVLILAVTPVLFWTIEEPDRPGSLSRKADVPPQPKIQFEGMTIWQALKDWVFWVTLIAAFIGLFVFNGLFPHMVPALIGKGFTQTTIVEVQFFILLLSVVGALVGGWAMDHYETAKVAVPFCLMSALSAFLILILSPAFGGVTLMAIALLLGGVSFNAMLAMGRYFPSRFFGIASFTEIVAVQFAITNVFAGLSAPLFGWIFDITKSYTLMFVFVIVLWFVAALCWFVLPKYRYAKAVGQAAPPSETVADALTTVAEGAKA